jgi:hypothetical protein
MVVMQLYQDMYLHYHDLMYLILGIRQFLTFFIDYLGCLYIGFIFDIINLANFVVMLISLISSIVIIFHNIILFIINNFIIDFVDSFKLHDD